MHITWHGQYTVKIVSKEATLVLDPYAPDTGLPPFRAKADIVALTNPSNSTMSHTDGVQGDYVVVDTPGEYSMSGMTLHALGWHAKDGSERSLHRWVIEDVSLLHVGALERELEAEELQELERTGIDILLVPVGGGSGLETKDALKLVTTIEPRVVIPIHYKVPKVKEKLETVEHFAKDMGVNPKKKDKKYTIRASKLPQEDMQTVILTP